VSLVGYAGERCIDAVEKNPRVHQYLLGSPFARLPRSLFLLWAPLKVLYQVRAMVAAPVAAGRAALERGMVRDGHSRVHLALSTPRPVHVDPS
jgi:hypothetical protein